MQFVDKALARRFEACEEMPQVLYARAFQKTRPEIGAAEKEICGGHMAVSYTHLDVYKRQIPTLAA